MNRQSGKKQSLHSKSLQRWGLWGTALLVLVVMLGGLGRILFSPDRAQDTLPTPDLGAMEPQVMAKLATLRSRAEQNPQSAQSWGALAMNYDVHGLKREAIPLYERAAELDPSEFRWPYYLAIVLNELGSSEARKWFDRSRSLWPTYAPLLVRSAQAEFDEGNFESAATSFQLALEIDSNLVLPHIGLARIAIARGDPSASLSNLESALGKAPNDAAVHSLLSEVYRRLDNPELAERARSIAEQMPVQTQLPDFVYASLTREGISSRWYQLRAQAYLDVGRPDSAVSLLERALAARPTPNTHNELGMALQFLGRLGEAEEHYQEALAMRPLFPEALINLSSLLSRTERMDEAIEALEQARELDPTVIQTYINLGIYNARRGRTDLAIAALRRGLEDAQYDIRVANRLAWLLATSPSASHRDGQEAVRLAEEVAEITRYLVAETLDVLAAAYAEVGRFREALETAGRAYDLAASRQQQSFAERIQGRVDLYEARRPFRVNAGQ